MTKGLRRAAVLCLLATGALAAATATMAGTGTTERYLHVKVDDAKNGESVNVNVPLSLAEKILPAVNKGNLHGGKVTVGDIDTDGVDIRGILDAIRTAPDNEFVTVKQKDQEVRVAKSNGNLIVHVKNNDKDGERVDVTVPMKVVDALFSTAKKDELDIAAAIRALSDAGDILIVTVQDASQHVRVWVDSKNTSE
jgi:hypothetical protein